LLPTLGFDRLVINGDMVIAHAGALRLHPGVIALAGTGSVVLGIGRNGERVKVGGWGPIYGDEGSAYRIGEMSLRAAARAHDKRGPATALEESLRSALEIDNFKQSLTRVYANGMQPREIAALSRIAYRIAETGDEVARRIFLEAADELADSVHAAIKQLTFDEGPIVVSYQGSVIESCHMLRDRLIERLKEKVSNAVVIAPEFAPVVGAYLLGCQQVGWIIDSEMVVRLKANSSSEETVGTKTPQRVGTDWNEL
jgi:N-acetylglucosamine kinase-like BadF-type ATPase